MRCSRRLAATAVIGVGLAGPVAACPVCSSGTGEQVRAGLVGGDLVRNVVATVAPFVVLGGVVLGIHFRWPGGGRAPQPRRLNKGGKGARHEP